MSSGTTAIGHYDDDTWMPVLDPNRISVDISYIRLLNHIALTLEEFRLQEDASVLFK